MNSLGFDLNRVFNELPIVAVILTLTEMGALLLESLARSNDQQLAGAIIFLLTASIVFLNFFTDMPTSNAVIPDFRIVATSHCCGVFQFDPFDAPLRLIQGLRQRTVDPVQVSSAVRSGAKC